MGRRRLYIKYCKTIYEMPLDIGRTQNNNTRTGADPVFFLRGREALKKQKVWVGDFFNRIVNCLFTY